MFPQQIIHTYYSLVTPIQNPQIVKKIKRLYILIVFINDNKFTTMN